MLPADRHQLENFNVAVAALDNVDQLYRLTLDGGLAPLRERLARKALAAAHRAGRFLLPAPQEPASPQTGTTLEMMQEKRNLPDLRTLRQARAEFERDWLAARVAEHNGNISAAASAAGLERSAASRKLKGLGVRAERDPAKPVQRRRKSKA